MSFKINFNNELDEKETRVVYTETMDELLSEDESVVTIDADLMYAIGLQNIMDKYPGRVMDVGVAEANMVGVAAGLSYAGKKPYVHSFACFATRRAFDQIFISCAYGRNNIKIFGSDPGITASFNGGTHMPFEDIGIMRTIPGSTVIDIADNIMLRDITRQIKDMDGVIYFRSRRNNPVKIYDPSSKFEIGKGNVLVDGDDVTIITSGIMVSESLLAADMLKKEGVSAAVIDMFTIKPIDADVIEAYAKKTGAVVTTDNHNENGGLGDVVAAVLCDRYPVPMKKLSVGDNFGEVGPFDYLVGRFGLNANGVVEIAKAAIGMK